jgi:DNA-binding NarL/FixJ family response regulator
MDLQVHIVSSHPLIACLIVRMLKQVRGLRGHVSPRPCVNPNLILPQSQPCLFVLDKYSAPLELPALCRLLRARCPGSKFLALAPPDLKNDEEILELLYSGVEGLVKFTDRVEEDLAQAVRALMAGGLWMPDLIIREYVRRTNLLLDSNLRPKPPLTARESQILQLVVRHLSNREIGGALEISERTVKFHVSNIYNKTRVQGRRELMSSIVSTTDKQASLSGGF